MHRRALYFGFAYAAFYIIFKLVIIIAGFSLSRFGYNYSHITAVVLLAPFFYLAVKWSRDRDYGGVISGREAMRICMTILAIAAVITSVYNYFEYDLHGRHLAVEYYNSNDFLDFLKRQKHIGAERYDSIIKEQLAAAEGAAFKATTGKLFSMLLIGFVSAFAISSAMKRSAAAG